MDILPSHVDFTTTLASTGLPVPLFVGLFANDPGKSALHSVAGWDAFNQQNAVLAKQNMRLSSIDTIEDNGTTYYTGVWIEGTGGYAIQRSADWSVVYNYWDANKNTLKIVDLDINEEGGVLRYTAIWRDSNGAQQKIVHDKGWDAFNAEGAILNAQGFYLVRVQSYQKSGEIHFTGIFETAPGPFSFLVISDWKIFHDHHLKMNNEGMRLIDFQYAPHSRAFIGIWQKSAVIQHLLYDHTWEGLVAQWQSLPSTTGLQLRNVEAYLAEPQWSKALATTLGTRAMGYAWKVSRKGKSIGEGVRTTRAAQDPIVANWTLDTRVNLCSASKIMTGVALTHLLFTKGYALNFVFDKPFYSFLESHLPKININPNIKSVTLRNLLTMRSGLQDIDPSGSLWNFLATYLQKGLEPGGVPGTTEKYINANYAILEGIVENVSGMSYVDYVTQFLLKPMGINTSVFSKTPDLLEKATLAYTNASDKSHGQYWGPMPFVGAGGWISSANEALKFLEGVRNNVVLPAPITQQMLEEEIGWTKVTSANNGTYYGWNGNLVNVANQNIRAAMVHFPSGYDAILLINSNYSAVGGDDAVAAMATAFKTREPALMWL